MAVKTRAELTALIASEFPDNTAGDISASDIRNFLTHVIDSAYIAAVDGTVAIKGQVAGRRELSGTTYTLALADAGFVVEMTNAAANVVTVPDFATVSFPVNTVITIEQSGGGETSISPDTGVTITSKDDNLIVGAKYSHVQLIKKAENIWSLVGDLK